MPNDLAPQANELPSDMTVDDAAMAMPDMGPSFEDLLSPAQAQQRQPRDPSSQQWRSHEADALRNSNSKTVAPSAEDQEALEADSQDGEDISAVDDEYFEVEVERDGKPFKERVKAQEVWAEAQEAKRLRAERDDWQKNVVPPEQWDQEILNATHMRGQLMRQLETMRAMQQPQMPDDAMLDEDSPRFNPAQYGRLRQLALAQNQRVQQIEQYHAQLAQEQHHQLSALQSAQMQRERDKLYKDVWPELKDQKEAARTHGDLIKHYGKYGVNDGYISKFDAAAFAIVKDALAYRSGLQAREAAVKVVRAKPRLVKGNARDTANPNTRRSTAAYQRLQQNPNDMDAAAAALDGLVF